MHQTPDYDSKKTLQNAPEMWLSEIRYIEKTLVELAQKNKFLNILEWGCGNSTIYFPKFLEQKGIPFKWFAMENFLPWHEKVIVMLKENSLSNDVDCFLKSPTYEANKNIQETLNLDEYIKLKEINENKEKLSSDDYLKLLFEFVKTNEKIPARNDTKYKNANIFSFFWNQKSKIESKDDEIYKKLSKNKILKENIDEYLDTKKKNKSKNKEKLSENEKINLLIEFVEKNKCLPKRAEEYKSTNIGRFLDAYKSKINSVDDDLYKKLGKNQIIKESVDKYLKMKEQNKGKENLSFDEMFLLLKEFTDEHDRNPTSKESYKNINIGIWLDNQKRKMSTKNDDVYIKLSKNKLVKENLDKYLLKDKK